MKNLNFLLLFGLLFSFTSIFSQLTDCNELPVKFENYNKAIYIIENTKFSFVDAVNTSTSPEIKAAEFFSCNEDYGYLFIKLNNKTLIYNKIPIDVWFELKNADFFEKYYNANIKKQYKPQLML